MSRSGACVNIAVGGWSYKNGGRVRVVVAVSVVGRMV